MCLCRRSCVTVVVLYCSRSRRLGFLRVFFFQAEDGIRDLVRSRGLGDVYKRQEQDGAPITGSKDLMFELYDAAEGGKLLWSEVQNLSLIHI
mgnify:CR=1 FL=1